MLVAICDDTKADAEKISFALMDIADDLETVWFENGAKLLESIKSGAFYALVFQDIYLENEMGVDVARAVKELSPNTQIIFVTTSLDHAIDAFRIQAADYLVKPCTEMDIVKAFARVNMRMNKPEPEPVVMNIGKEIHIFYPEKVIKIESDRHYTVIHQQNRHSTRVHMNFSDAAALFGSVSFTSEYEESVELNYSLEYATSSGADAVVFYSVPFEFYEYELNYYDKEHDEIKATTRTLCMPKKPCTATIELEKYQMLRCRSVRAA